MQDLYKELKEYGSVKANEPMKKYTTFKIGGPARFFVTVTTTEDVVGLLRFLDGEGIAYAILGGGSNMLVHDEGFDGVMIHIASTSFIVRDTILEADAGCITANIARESVNAGLTGFEWAVGVPGTMGGAVRGNAGAMNEEMKDAVHEVDAYQDGEVVTLNRKACGFGYRDSTFKHSPAVILRVRLALTKGNKGDGMKKMMNCIGYRTTTQPKGFASIGCIFKNYDFSNQTTDDRRQSMEDYGKKNIPKEFLEKKRIPAGWLVEEVGMKGVERGDVCVSPVHGNFIVNKGKGTAAAVLTLIEEIKQKVYDTFEIALEEEIQIMG